MRLFALFAGILMAVALIVSCQNDETIAFRRYYSSGAAVYIQHCQNCHGTKGEGLSALIPPLTDSVYLQANQHQLACYLQDGLKGPVLINGKQFDGEMPPSKLSPIEIAQVLTYVRNSFGNKNGLTDQDMVLADLNNCK